ncbi:hypothetical protein PVK06_043744 [Gossypium arboreum]|uniref:RNase H type-1 domain-containing protein n=1 Tax=Gossypium arboreum TaxID=29729 RepID=A0ABR0MRB9_GOSAR|nr:hypothetical protein PVK06_043744 [Gossypium arboreum]
MATPYINKHDKSRGLVVFVRSYCAQLTVLAGGVLQASSNSIARWYPPPWDFVKVNVDTGFQLGQKKASSGVVIRDENGQILGAYSRTTYLVLFVFAAEAIAVTHGLRFAYELGFFTTHAMAKDGLSCDEDRFWVEEALTVVVAAAAEDRRLSDPP